MSEDNVEVDSPPKTEEAKNRRLKDKQVKRYDLKNMASRFQKCMTAL